MFYYAIPFILSIFVFILKIKKNKFSLYIDILFILELIPCAIFNIFPLKHVILFALLFIWVYVLGIFKNVNLGFFYFFTGAIGLFVILYFFMNLIKGPFIYGVVYTLGKVGKVIPIFTAYPETSIFFINNKKTVMSFYLDLECSGIIEMIAFSCMLLFFPIYKFKEKVLIVLGGSIYIVLANFIRIFFIILTIFLFGTSFYPLAHSIFGRLIFYILTVFLFYIVFTKRQLKKQQVGAFSFNK